MSAVGAGLRTEDSPDLRRRVLAAAVVLLAIVAVAVLLFRGDGGYTVTAEFINAGQLVKGNQVKAGGVSIGSVKSIDVSQDGHAEVELGISDDDYKPLRSGTQVMIKQQSLSGIANRYVDLKLGPANGEEIDDGGTIGPDQTGAVRGRPGGPRRQPAGYSIRRFSAPCRGTWNLCSSGSRKTT